MVFLHLRLICFGVPFDDACRMLVLGVSVWTVGLDTSMLLNDNDGLQCKINYSSILIPPFLTICKVLLENWELLEAYLPSCFV